MMPHICAYKGAPCRQGCDDDTCHLAVVINGVLDEEEDVGTYYGPVDDDVNHPTHYTSHPSGVECIQITEHMGFNLGNALKYIWRADLKDDPIENLRKARWYIDREMNKREREKGA